MNLGGKIKLLVRTIVSPKTILKYDKLLYCSVLPPHFFVICILTGGATATCSAPGSVRPL